MSEKLLGKRRIPLCPLWRTDCFLDACAWYNKDRGACVLKSIAWDLDRLADCTNRGVFLTTKP